MNEILWLRVKCDKMHHFIIKIIELLVNKMYQNHCDYVALTTFRPNMFGLDLGLLYSVQNYMCENGPITSLNHFTYLM